MPETLIIADTSCLILLSKINELGLLKASYSKIVITPQIAQEFEEVVPYWIEAIEVKNTIIA